VLSHILTALRYWRFNINHLVSTNTASERMATKGVWDKSISVTSVFFAFLSLFKLPTGINFWTSQRSWSWHVYVCCVFRHFWRLLGSSLSRVSLWKMSLIVPFPFQLLINRVRDRIQTRLDADETKRIEVIMS